MRSGKPSELLCAMQKAGARFVTVSRIEGQVAAKAVLDDGMVIRGDSFTGSISQALWALGGELIKHGRKVAGQPATVTAEPEEEDE